MERSIAQTGTTPREEAFAFMEPRPMPLLGRHAKWKRTEPAAATIDDSAENLVTLDLPTEGRESGGSS